MCFFFYLVEVLHSRKTKQQRKGNIRLVCTCATQRGYGSIAAVLVIALTCSRIYTLVLYVICFQRPCLGGDFLLGFSRILFWGEDTNLFIEHSKQVNNKKKDLKMDVYVTGPS